MKPAGISNNNPHTIDTIVNKANGIIIGTAITH
jgi:hypothetical protein